MAARIPGIFDPAIDAPTPEPHTSTPRSASPDRMVMPMSLEIRVVDPHLRGLDAEIDDLGTLRLERAQHRPAESRAPVVERDCDLHPSLRYAKEDDGKHRQGSVMDERELWRELGQQLRVDAVRASAKAGSGHPTSSMSAADLAAVLLAAHFRYDFEHPHSPANDRLVFSKGHASPLVYGLFRAAGVLSEEELGTYRQFGSRLEGHPTPVLPWVDVATGSLGQGLPIGVGMGLAGKRLDWLPFRVWVICGDSEMAEGSMWEAAEHAAFYELDNLTAIIDVNRLGQRGETMHGWDLSSYAERLEAFGWHTIEINGHDVGEIDEAYREAESTTGRPTAVIARTIKGKGYSKVENENGWHGKAIAEEAVQELGGIRNIEVDVPRPQHGEPHRFEP